MALRHYIQTSSSGVKNLTCMARQGTMYCVHTEKNNITISTLGWISAFITLEYFHFIFCSFSLSFLFQFFFFTLAKPKQKLITILQRQAKRFLR